MSNSIFRTKKSLLLDHKIRYEDFASGKYVQIVWNIRGYYYILSPMDSEADANGSWNTLCLSLREVHTLDINFREERAPDLSA
jgi:hypothetical protein